MPVTRHNTIRAIPKVAVLKVGELQPAKDNSRMISPGTLSGLASSIERFGNVEATMVSVWERKKCVMAGHQRSKVLIDRSIKDILCAIVSCLAAEERLLNLTRVQDTVTAIEASMLAS